MNELNILRADPSAAAAVDTNLRVEERLPFTIRLVQNQEDLQKAILIRHAAYGRHLPEFAETLKSPEASDRQDGVVILLAEAKLDRSPIGTMRIQTNLAQPLALEQSIELPDWMAGRSLAEATRLGITEERIGRVAKTALFKAYYQYCAQNSIDWMVIAGRSPIDRQYDRLLFEDVYPGMGYVALRHAGNMPHRVMALKVSEVKSKWAAASHPLFNYFFRTFHPDINTDARVVASTVMNASSIYKTTEVPLLPKLTA